MKIARLLSPDILESVALVVEETPVPEKSGINSLRSQIMEAHQPKAVEPLKVEVVDSPEVPELPIEEPVKAKDATPTDNPDEYTKTLSKKSQARFLEMMEKRAAALSDEKMKSVKQITPEFEKEYEGLKKTKEELSAQIRQLDVERSPEFRQKFVERPEAIKEQLSEIASTYDISKDELFNAINGGKATRAKLNEMLLSVGIIDQNQAAQLVIELQKIESDKAVVIKDSQTALKLLQEQRQNEGKAYVEKLVASRREALLKDAPIIENEIKEIGLFQGEQGEALKADIMSSIGKLNDADLERMSPKDRAALITSAFMSKPLFNELKTARERIKDLEGKLSSFDKSKPALGGRAPAKVVKEETRTFLERARAGEI